MQLKKIAAALALTSLSSIASAQMYGEVGYSFVEYEEDVFGETADSSPQALRLILGHEINENLAVEGMLGFGVNDDSVKISGFGTIPGSKFEVENYYGVYLKPKMKTSPEVELFGRVGFAKAKAKISVEGESVSGNESGFSYGVGLSYAVSKDMKLSVDYMSIVDKSDVKATGFTVGVGFAF